jgi:hypothetical protein
MKKLGIIICMLSATFVISITFSTLYLIFHKTEPQTEKILWFYNHSEIKKFN